MMLPRGYLVCIEKLQAPVGGMLVNLITRPQHYPATGVEAASRHIMTSTTDSEYISLAPKLCLVEQTGLFRLEQRVRSVQTRTHAGVPGPLCTFGHVFPSE
jgi:hypothetical protein